MYGQHYTTSDEPYWPSPPPPAPPTVAEHTAVELPAFVSPATSIDPRAHTAAIAVLVSAGIVLVAALTRSWFTAGESNGLGLLGIETCGRGLCQSVWWYDLPVVPGQIVAAATAGLLGCLATIGLLAHTGVRLLRGERTVRLRWVGSAIALAFAGTLGFVVSLSVGEHVRGLSLGWSTIVGFAGLFAAAISTATMVRPLRS